MRAFIVDKMTYKEIGKKSKIISFNPNLRYIVYLLSLNNSRLGDYLHLIYRNEFEVKDTTDSYKICFIL